MNFGPDEIRLLRQIRNMQQKNVARIMGISPQRYSILENNVNRPTKRTSEILRALGFDELTARNFLDSIPGNREKNELQLVGKNPIVQ